MKRFIPWFTLLFFTVIFISCQYDNEEELYGENEVCDTSNITYSQTVKLILSNNCYGCHSASKANSFGAGINLETYSELIDVVDNGRLIGSVEHLSGYDSMPLSGAKLDDCTIEKIKVWISDGAIEN